MESSATIPTRSDQAAIGKEVMLKHFLWKSLGGALQSRHIPIDGTCSSCEESIETICHALFECRVAKNVWRLSGFPLPASGFSPTSVFLNVHHLLTASKKSDTAIGIRLAFPWILWHLWKSRNSLVFEQTRSTPEEIVSKALDEVDGWLRTKDLLINPSADITLHRKWVKPPLNTLKCNIGVSWILPNRNCGVAWIVRDHNGDTLFHSRRSYSAISSSRETLKSLVGRGIIGIPESIEHYNGVFMRTNGRCNAPTTLFPPIPRCDISILHSPKLFGNMEFESLP
ncbi:unnamed protein product [Thlaspi arvense]|uniref:Reverse transcriptase zinc-binding domain-containing protein n=1 Tax=Thlaspi arvense TaxID=13288 RepID=A0AAU9T7C5_THLAR|nr:unnamed protein product [Thlaspi arvense]